MKTASALLSLGSVAYAAAQGNAMPSDIEPPSYYAATSAVSIPAYGPVSAPAYSPLSAGVPIFGAPQASTVVTITYTSGFGDAVPAGFVTVMTLPVYPSGPVYSQATGPAAVPTSILVSSHLSAGASHRSSGAAVPTSTPTLRPTTSASPSTATSATAQQQTGTNAAVAPMATAVGVPAAVAAAAGWALL